jgi:Pyruvate/2-oxoacid:ferredoxin oxidoreductase gamma subunit
MALAAGNAKAANIAVLGAFIGASKIVGYDNLVKVLKNKLGSKKNILDINLRVLEEGYKLARDAMKKAGKKEQV